MKNSLMGTGLTSFFAVALLWSLLANSEEMSAPPLFPEPFAAKAITGRVVDAATGEPIPRVIIVAQWMIDRHFVGDDNALLKVMETVTDSEGDYSFPAWGPIRLPSMADFRMGIDPEVAYFKRGYWPEWVSNGVISEIRYRATPLGEFKGNGQTIKLRKWDGSDVGFYQTHLRHLANGMPAFYKGGDWQRYPRMAIEIADVGIVVQEQTRSIVGPACVRGFYPELFTEEDRQLIRSVADEE